MARNYTLNGVDLDTYYMTTSRLLDSYVTTGSYWTWGLNDFGQLGTNDLIHRSSPVQTVSGGTNWVSSGTMGRATNSSAIKTDGRLWIWGSGAFGLLGDNTVGASKSSPIQTVSGGTNWRAVSTGSSHSLGIKNDGTLWTWGLNTYGSIGDNTLIHRSSPVQTVSGGNSWRMAVAVGTNGQVLSIKNDGTLWTWGYNGVGTLGDNTTINKSSPVQTVAGGTTWKFVTGGGDIAAAIKTDGTLWLWGEFGTGGGGDNTVVPKSSPVQTIAGGTNWKTVSCGNGGSVAAIKADGTLWTWGTNSNGQLGDNTTTSRSSPIQTISSGTSWRDVTCGGNSSFAIKTDGSLWTWGYNLNGELGDNTVTHRSSPVQTVAGGTNWKLTHANGGIYFYDAYNQYPK